MKDGYFLIPSVSRNVYGGVRLASLGTIALMAPIEVIRRIAHDIAGTGHVAGPFGDFKQRELSSGSLAVVAILVLPC